MFILEHQIKVVMPCSGEGTSLAARLATDRMRELTFLWNFFTCKMKVMDSMGSKV